MDDKLYYAESILSAAVSFDGELVLSMPRPNRHHHILQRIDAMSAYGTATQGFITDRGRFVDRLEAMKLARSSGQLLGKITVLEDELFSEDLW